MKHLRFFMGVAFVMAPLSFAAAQRGANPGAAHPNWTVGTYLDQLGQQMAITPRQQRAWKKYAETMSDISKPLQTAHPMKMEAMDTASWHERCRMMDQMLMTRKEAADTAHRAATELMPALNAEQKQKAKAIVPGLVLPPAAGFG